MAERYFSLQEAEALLPLVRRHLEDAISKKHDIEKIDEEIARAAARVMSLGGSVPPYANLVKIRAQRGETVAQIAKAIEEIQANGCLVKDLDQGLVDFPTLRDGNEALLCWKLGEERIGWWHGLEEGFAGRKPVERPASEDPPSSSHVQ